MHTRKGLRLEDDVDLFLQTIFELNQEDDLSKGANGFPVGQLYQKLKTIVEEEPIKTSIWDYSTVREFADTLTRRRILNRFVNDKGIPLYSINLFMEQGTPANVMYSRRMPLLSSAKRTALLSAEQAQEVEQKAASRCKYNDDCFYDSDVYMTLRNDLDQGSGVVPLYIQDRYGNAYKGKISDLIPSKSCLSIISRDRNLSDFVKVDFAVYERENGSMHATEAAVQTENNTRNFHPRGTRVYVMKYCPFIPPTPCPPIVPVAPCADQSNIMFFELLRRTPRGDNTISIRDKDHFLEDMIAASQDSDTPVTVIINSKKYVVEDSDVMEDYIDIILSPELMTSAEKGAIIVFSSEKISVQKCSCMSRGGAPRRVRARRARSGTSSVAISSVPTVKAPKTATLKAFILDGHKRGSTELVIEGDYKELQNLLPHGTRTNLVKIESVTKGSDPNTIKIKLAEPLSNLFRKEKKTDEKETFVFQYVVKNIKDNFDDDEEELDVSEKIDQILQEIDSEDYSNVDVETILQNVDEKHRLIALSILTKDMVTIKSATPTTNKEGILQLQNVSQKWVRLLGNPVEVPTKGVETLVEVKTPTVIEEKKVETPAAVETLAVVKTPAAVEEKKVEPPMVVEQKQDPPKKFAIELPSIKSVPPVVVITYYDESDRAMSEKHMISLVEYENEMMPTPLPGAVSYSVEKH